MVVTVELSPGSGPDLCAHVCVPVNVHEGVYSSVRARVPTYVCVLVCICPGTCGSGRGPPEGTVLISQLRKWRSERTLACFTELTVLLIKGWFWLLVPYLPLPSV